MDVRTITGATLSSGFDWNFPLPVSGTVQNIPIGILPANTQLYLVAFNGGSFNTSTPSQSYLSASDWAVVKDNANVSPADLGTKTVILSTAVGSTEVLVGTDSGVNVLVGVPEPTTVAFGVLLAFAGLMRQRRQRH